MYRIGDEMTEPFYTKSESGDEHWEWIYPDFRFMIYCDSDDGTWNWICVGDNIEGNVTFHGDIPDALIKRMKG